MFLNAGSKIYAAACSGPIDASSAPANCDVGIHIAAVAGTLTATSDPTVTLTTNGGAGGGTIIGGNGSPSFPYTYSIAGGTAQTFNLAFNTILVDGRGGTTGWNLAASTSDLPTDSAVQFTGVNASCNSTCVPAVTGTGTGNLSSGTFPLTIPATVGGSSGAEFIGAPGAPGGTYNTGSYTLATVGTLTLPAGVAAGTLINGLLTVTLTNANF